MRIAVEGCAHGELEKIYETINFIEKRENYKVDLLICCGDFQATRNEDDLHSMSIPKKFYNMCTFYKYYSGEKVAPILTIFIGGNHEASNYLQELPYGGWVAPNIYYLGYAGCVNVNGIRIGGLSACDKSKCKGPTAYYASLGCKPVYEDPSECCPFKYDCDYLKSRSTNKCYVNGRAYNLGTKLEDRDANPCDIGCTCLEDTHNIAAFTCAIKNCFTNPVQPGCYRKNSPFECCPGEEVCPETPEDRAVCVVDGKEYKEGEHFFVKSEPDKKCVCAPGYEGKNVAPFCARSNHPYCDPYFSSPYEVVNNCAPVYYNNEPLQTSCSVFNRCQNKDDKVIESSSPDKTRICLFGTFTLYGGDELKMATDYSSVCVKCVCEVGPFLTCQSLPDSECDSVLILGLSDFNL